MDLLAEDACDEDHNLAEVVDSDDHHRQAEIAAVDEMDDTDDVDMVVSTAQSTQEDTDQEKIDQ